MLRKRERERARARASGFFQLHYFIFKIKQYIAWRNKETSKKLNLKKA